MASPIILAGSGLRVGFHQHGDRLAHTIAVCAEDGRIMPLLASVEGTDEEPWPPSPPLTTIDTRANEGCRTAMLVGMAGRSHWSLVVELDPASRLIRFEVACRVKESAAWLGSRYRAMVSPVAAGSGELIFAIDGMCVQVAPLATPALAEQERTAGRTQSRSTIEAWTGGEGFEVRATAAGRSFPQTVSWGYSLARLG